jgi:GntR family transcriptional regulator
LITIDHRSPIPIFDQIKAGLKGLVSRGMLNPGDQVPSIRSLAEVLLVNPNTIARAYRELILEGFLESRRGEGNFIARNGRSHAVDGLEGAKERLRDALQYARRAGLGWKDISSVLQDTKKEEP